MALPQANLPQANHSIALHLMTYSLGPLPDDPSQERILLEVIDNPHGRHQQVMFCIDVASVTPDTEVRCDGSPWLFQHCANDILNRFPGEWPRVTYRGPAGTGQEIKERRKAAKANGTYIPTLREVLQQEETSKRRRERNAAWMRKQRTSQRQEHQSATCTHCGASFERKRSTARFCSTACRVAAHRKAKAGELPRP